MDYGAGYRGRRANPQSYGWEYRWTDGSRGYDQGYQAEFEGGPSRRPWVGGYRGGYQGGTGGYAVNTTGPLRSGYDADLQTGYERGYRGVRAREGYDRGFAPRHDRNRGGSGRGYDPEYARRRWPHAYRPAMRGYDGGYEVPRDLWPDEYRPNYSPVGGNYAAMGGRYRRGETPRPLADWPRTSEFTRRF